MTDEPPDDAPNDEPDDKQKDTGDVAAWQSHLSALASQIDEVKTEIATLKAQGQTGKSPEVEALQDQLKTLQVEVQEAKQELALTKAELADLSQTRLSAQKEEKEDSPTLVQKTEELSGQTEQSAQSHTTKPTRASRLGWL